MKNLKSKAEYLYLTMVIYALKLLKGLSYIVVIIPLKILDMVLTTLVRCIYVFALLIFAIIQTIKGNTIHGYR